MTLEGALCTVRHWRAADADSLVAHADNVKIAEHLRDRFPHPYTKSDARAFLAHSAAPGGRELNLAVEVEGQAAGAIGLNPGTDVERYSAEVGYWLGEVYWGRGIITEALVLLTEHAFARLNLLRLFALPFAANAASARVLEKAGYQKEGLLRASAVKFGRPRDQLLFSRINDHWDPARESQAG